MKSFVRMYSCRTVGCCRVYVSSLGQIDVRCQHSQSVCTGCWHLPLTVHFLLCQQDGSRVKTSSLFMFVMRTATYQLITLRAQCRKLDSFTPVSVIMVLCDHFTSVSFKGQPRASALALSASVTTAGQDVAEVLLSL